ncbi:MAG: hypothetical protein DI535_18890 [Citrobacter freundii]|nr:MAG: hypothetical protein DI535_18890 [Citrobacter freundii]
MRSLSRFFLLITGLLAGLMMAGCNAGTLQKKKKEPVSDGLFVDCQAIGYEERPDVTVRVQFRMGGPEGDAVMLEEPAMIYFDGLPMDTGSTKMTGGYYEAVFEAAAEETRVGHEIHYKDASGQSFRDTFYFPFFRLAKELPESVNRDKDLEISFTGLGKQDEIHAMLSDTSYYGRGIDRIDTIENGLLKYTAADLKTLKDGPVHIEFYKEDEWWLRRQMVARGRVYLSYSISREFELRE